MNIQTYKYPKIDKVDFAFPSLGTDKVLLNEAIARGFYNGRTPYNTLFSSLFFKGGKVEFKTEVDEVFKRSAWPYCIALMRSWEPKHEEKEAVCAMLMSELLEAKPSAE